MRFPVDGYKVVTGIDIFTKMKSFHWDSDCKCFVHNDHPSIIFPCDIIDGYVKIRDT